VRPAADFFQRSVRALRLPIRVFPSASLRASAIWVSAKRGRLPFDATQGELSPFSESGASEPDFALGMRRLGSMLARLKPSPFKATAPAGTLAPTSPGWTDEGVRPYVDCADFHADKSVRLNVGGRGRPSSIAPATQLQVRMLVSRRIAITFRDCVRGLAQVLPSRKSGARSG